MIPPHDETGIDLSPEEFRRLGYRAIDLLTEHFAALATARAARQSLTTCGAS